MFQKKLIPGLLGVFLLMLLLGLTVALESQQSVEEMYEAAIFKKDADGDLEGAIQLFREIVKKFPKNLDIASKAQLQIGLCYEKLGNKASQQAQEAFRKVIDNYPQQTAQVKAARQKLAVLLRASSAVSSGDKETRVRKVWDKADDWHHNGSPSPDGRYITFTDYNSGNLGIRDLLKDESRFLTQSKSRGAASWSIFSPDGSQIAYTWQNIKDWSSELRLIGMEGGESRILYKDAGSPFPISWSKDGNRILVKLAQKDSLAIAFVSIKDGSSQKIRSFPSENFKLKGAGLSPDGLFIAYSCKMDGSANEDIHIMSAKGNNLTPLITHPADDVFLGWSPDGKHVLFMSDRTGSNDLWTIQVNDGKPDGYPLLVKPSLGNIRPLGLTPTGSLYYGIVTGWCDIFTAEIDPETGKVLSSPVMAVQKYEGFNSTPDWSSEGRYIVCRSSRGTALSGDELALLILSTQTEEIREVPLQNTGGLNFHFLRWSPDGRSILGVGTDEKGKYGALLAFDAVTGESEIIARSDGKNGIIFQPEWAPDGKSVFFTRKVVEKQKILHNYIVQHDIETGEEKKLFDAPILIGLLTLSPNGQELAFWGKGTVMLLSTTNGGEPRKLFQQDKTISSMTWSADGRFLFYGKKRDAESTVNEVWRISVEGGEPKKLDLAMNMLMHLRMHPAGRKIAFTASIRPQASEIWVMENFLPWIQDKK